MKINKYFTSKLLITITILALLASCGGGQTNEDKSPTNTTASPTPEVTTSPSSSTSSFSTAYEDYQTAIDTLIKGIPNSAEPNENKPKQNLPKLEIATQFKGVADTLTDFRTASQEFQAQNKGNQKIVAKLKDIEAINKEIEKVLIVKDQQDEDTVKILQTAMGIGPIDGDYGQGTRTKLVNYLTDRKKKITESYNAINSEVKSNLPPSPSQKKPDSSPGKVNSNPLQNSRETPNPSFIVPIVYVTLLVVGGFLVLIWLMRRNHQYLLRQLEERNSRIETQQNQIETQQKQMSTWGNSQISEFQNSLEIQQEQIIKELREQLRKQQKQMDSWQKLIESDVNQQSKHINEYLRLSRLQGSFDVETLDKLISNFNNLKLSNTLQSIKQVIHNFSEGLDTLNALNKSANFSFNNSLQKIEEVQTELAKFKKLANSWEDLEKSMRTYLNNLTQQISTIQPQITDLEQELNTLKPPLISPTDPETSSTTSTKYDDLTCPFLDDYFHSYHSLKDKIFVEPTEESLSKYKQNIIDLILQECKASTPSSKDFFMIRHSGKLQEEDLYWLFIKPQLKLGMSNILTIHYFFKDTNQPEEYIKEDERGKTCKLSKPALVVETPGTPRQWKLINTGLMEMVS